MSMALKAYEHEAVGSWSFTIEEEAQNFKIPFTFTQIVRRRFYRMKVEDIKPAGNDGMQPMARIN
jgi:hypothetical protein